MFGGEGRVPGEVVRSGEAGDGIGRGGEVDGRRILGRGKGGVIGFWLIHDRGGGLVIALILTITNTLAFSRCDKFSQAENLASSAMYSGGLARNIAGGLVSRLFRR